ncbi:hypothetical protein KW782_02370 [Candidatus Parcubacteria bacterium]|nr:hypothetical protein [Candidatus Parcubacteria bacterium]
MPETNCRHCGQQLHQTTIEGGGKQRHCINNKCPSVRYLWYTYHKAGGGARKFLPVPGHSKIDDLQYVEVPPSFEPSADWDGQPPPGFEAPLSFADWQAQGEPER